MPAMLTPFPDTNCPIAMNALLDDKVIETELIVAVPSDACDVTDVPAAPNCWLTIKVLSAMVPPLSDMPTPNLNELLTPLTVADTDPPTVAVVPLMVQLVAVTVNTETRLLEAEDSGLV